jgi:hypothetical protein
MTRYQTEKGIVIVELDKHRRPVFRLPAGMHGEIWFQERDRLHDILKKDYLDVVLTKPKER